MLNSPFFEIIFSKLTLGAEAATWANTRKLSDCSFCGNFSDFNEYSFIAGVF
jgi:hypothetical protein